MVKKLFSVLLLCAMLVTLAAPAFAGEEPSTTTVVSVGDYTWDSDNENRQVTVQFSIANNPGVAVMQFDILYDKTKLKLATDEWENVAYTLDTQFATGGTGNMDVGDSSSTGTSISYSNQRNATANGTFLTLTFEIVGNWCGTENIALAKALNTDGNENGSFVRADGAAQVDISSQVTMQNGSITVNGTKGNITHKMSDPTPATKPADLGCEESWDQTAVCAWCGNKVTVTNPAAGHDYDIEEGAVPPSDTAEKVEDGHYAYKHCSVCEKWFIYKEGLDKAPVEGTSAADAVWPVEHDLEFHAQKNADCAGAEAGNTNAAKGVAAHYECLNCGKWFSDITAKTEVSDEDCVLEPVHNVQWIAAVDPDCANGVAGTKAHWGCVNCGKAYKGAETDETPGAEMTPTEKADLSVPATHKAAEGVGDAVDANCGTNTAGNKKYYQCEYCGKIFEDAAFTRETTLAAMTIAPEHDIVYVAAVPASGSCGDTPNTAGTKEHYKCSICNTRFFDAEGTKPVTSENESDLDLLPSTEHKMKKVDATDGDCATGKPAVQEHYECENCGKWFSDQAGQNEIAASSISEAATHTFGAKVNVQPATCTPKLTDGVKEHYKCENCGQLAIDKTDESQADKVQGDYELVDEDALVIKAEHNYGELQEAVAADCTPGSAHDGMAAYYQCSVCEKYFNESKILVSVATLKTKAEHDYGSLIAEKPFQEIVTKDETTGEITKVEFPDGEKAHYVCAICGYAFVEEDGEKASVGKYGESEATAALKITGDHTFGDFVPAKEASEDSDGTLHDGYAAYYRCSVCGQYFDSDKSNPSATKTVTTAEHTVKLVPAADPTHGKKEDGSPNLANGNSQYMKCDICGQCFDVQEAGVKYDAYLTAKSVSDFVIAPTHTITAVAETAPTHTAEEIKDGVAAHYACSECGMLFSDAEGKTETTADALVIKSDHTYTFVEAVPADCEKETPGTAEHYTCVCGKIFSVEGEGASAVYTEIIDPSDLVLPAEHSITLVAAADATCYTDGKKAHYTCENCKKVFADDEGEIELEQDDVIIPKLNHKNMVEVQERASTYKLVGVEHHWYCPDCGSYFLEKSDDSTQPDLTTPLKEEDVQKEPVTKLKGDADGDGVVSGTDLLLARMYFANRTNQEILARVKMQNLDVNDDGVVSGTDLLILRMHFANRNAGYLD